MSLNLDYCFTADFETTTDVNDCRVWAYSICNIGDPSKFYYGNSIDEFFDWIIDQPKNLKFWWHNLKFDAQFTLNYLFEHNFTWIPDKKLRADNTFTTLITDTGQYYSITIYFKVKNGKTHKVEFFDSMKIFPNFSVETIAESFNLPIKKLKLDYKAKREVGHILTKEEIDYIRNDVEIVARALQVMFLNGQTRMTIASDALNDFKNRLNGFRRKFPKLDNDVDANIRKSYRGGFTWVNEVCQNKMVGKGIVLDVNSLYPSTLVNCVMPYGKPIYYKGRYQEDKEYPLYVQTLSCSFELKEGKIPSIQLRNTMGFRCNEYVKSSKGKVLDLTLTSVDLELFFTQYNVKVEKWVGGWKFKGAKGMFDDYINYWTEQKIKAGKEGNKGVRQLSKLMLNSLYR